MPAMPEVLESRNPARPDEVVGVAPVADVAGLEAEVAAARAAQADWDALGIVERGRILRRAAGELERRAEDLAVLLTAEQGKTLDEARVEVGGSVETLLYHAGHARDADGATYPSGNPDELIRTVRVPVGLVAAITPWNFPVQIPAWKLAPALLHGNAVLWKPSSETPMTSLALAEALVAGGLPAGVLRVLIGGGEVGRALVAHPAVGAITFTGSVPVGRGIAVQAAERGAKVQLELGGHSACIVCPDVDPAWAAGIALAGAMGGTGQKCTATRRVIAVGGALEPLLAELRRQTPLLVVGDGATAGAQIGPLVSAGARDGVAAALAAALAEGAEVVAEAPVPAGGGWYLAPTVLQGGPDLAICREEVFGPVAVVLAVDDLDGAIALANATDFGLTATVLTRDERVIRRCVRELEAGIVKANAPNTGSELHVPFGGLKDSSFPAPREQNAASAAEFFTWSKSAYLRVPPEAAL
ncbi:MAG: aldehyde dehydrogenase family protein [Actinobacteria bacterium]|nr:aldehyde dehydrogenase family protein [Actinomycetota bacterium]